MTALQAYLQNSKTRKVLSKKPGEAGFSLIELVVVVAVLAILSAIAIPAFTSISEKARAAAAANTLATIVKECAVKLNDGGGTYVVPTLDGYKGSTSSSSTASGVTTTTTTTYGWLVGAGTTPPTSPATCSSTEDYRLASTDLSKYPTFIYANSTGAKTCRVTTGSAAVDRGCSVDGGSW